MRVDSPEVSSSSPLLVAEGPLAPGSPRLNATASRSVSLLQVAFLGFFIVSGGPLGLEPVVQAAGAGPALLGFILAPIIFAFPQCLLVAELASLMPENGGTVLWTYEAFGHRAAFTTAYLNLLSNTFDLALYPSLAVAYLSEIANVVTVTHWLVIVGLGLFFFYLNFRGVDLVGDFSMLFCGFIFLPFVIEGFYAAWKGKLHSDVWFKTTPTIDWASYCSYLYWNYSGFTSIGNLAGEVRNPQRTFPLAVSFTIFLIVVSYLWPVMVGVCLSPDFAAWDNGHFIDAARVLGNWMRVWIALAGLAAALGMFNANLGTYARVLWRSAHSGYLPRFLAYSVKDGSVPVAALLYHTVTACAIGSLPIGAIVDFSVLAASLVLVIVLAAFLVRGLRHQDSRGRAGLPVELTRAAHDTAPRRVVSPRGAQQIRRVFPRLRRPYRAPGGWAGAIMLAFFPFCCVVALLVFSGWVRSVSVVGGALVFGLLVYPLWRAYVLPFISENNEYFKLVLVDGPLEDDIDDLKRPTPGYNKLPPPVLAMSDNY